jgi:peptidoglycan/xylan/chitin deacetylase (PgdA/CDA1 family)
MKKLFFIAAIAGIISASTSFKEKGTIESWVRINQLGYTPHGIKVAVWCSKNEVLPESCELIDATTHQTMLRWKPGKAYGAYGPFVQTARLDFSAFDKPGRYYVKAGEALSPEFTIGKDVYKGTADFCLRYMRQQRSGFNPYLKDSCHTHDGYTLYGPMPDSTHINVTGGWHDASDYLQYTTTSANAVYHLLAAYRDFPQVFEDTRQANGLEGANGIADVLDEARWGIDWLLKMNPKDGWFFNQLGDDRDHRGMRIPKEDTNYYGRGLERPVYFCSGKPQVRGKFMNATTGIASTAGKFASSFALAAQLYAKRDKELAALLMHKAAKALEAGQQQPGVCQTASVRSPYIYAEGNWTDDMELGAAAIRQVNPSAGLLQQALGYARQEPVTPWLGADTAQHYQWYPFVNIGHYELAKQLHGKQREVLTGFYHKGIHAVWRKASTNAFFRAIPFIWCSNNLTVSFATQCYWYRQLTGDTTYEALEQANLDWLFGCNPWGTSMVYGLPSWGDTPVDPHSAFTHLKNYPIDGGLVDGPVYTAIYRGLIGIQLKDADEYEAFQSDMAVYHDDYGDYSTNEPTMDGTASLIYLLAAKEAEKPKEGNKRLPVRWKGKHLQQLYGTVTRGDSSVKEICLVFTGDEFGEGLPVIFQTLKQQRVKGSFFFTGRFYRNKDFQAGIRKLYEEGHYMGPHSDAHLLYCDWKKRDSTLITRGNFIHDLNQNLQAMRDAGIKDASYQYLVPPYEWWNGTVARWSNETGIRLVSFTPGTGTNADYTWPEMGASYKSSETILHNIHMLYENRPGKLNGVILLVHAGTDPRRKDKLYNRLNELINYLKKEGYSFKRMDELLADQ